MKCVTFVILWLIVVMTSSLKELKNSTQPVMQLKQTGMHVQYSPTVGNDCQQYFVIHLLFLHTMPILFFVLLNGTVVCFFSRRGAGFDSRTLSAVEQLEVRYVQQALQHSRAYMYNTRLHAARYTVCSQLVHCLLNTDTSDNSDCLSDVCGITDHCCTTNIHSSWLVFFS